MRLLRIRLRNVGPFEDTVLSFAPPDDSAPEAEDGVISLDNVASEAPRPLTVLFGGDGTGKTTILNTLSLTRPGHALPPLPSAVPKNGEGPAWIATDWLLGEDDPVRPHPLVVASPSAVLTGETLDTAGARRREQAIFDRRAQQEGGHVFVAFSGARWFSRVPNMLSLPERTILRYDIRQPNTSFDDPTRADLTREVKQVLSYSSIAAALADGRAELLHLARLEQALREVLAVVLEPFDLVHAGVNPTTLEPQARLRATGAPVPFDAIPRAARHLIAFVTLPLRALAAAYPTSETPREREGVVAIDDAENQQDPSILRDLPQLLRRALPNVQWILTTSSTQLAVACDATEVLALRRTAPNCIELGEGQLH